MKTIKDKSIETYVESLTEFQRGIVLAIRDVVLSAHEDVKEGMKWGSIAFFNHKNICGFRVAKAHITLLFMEGASLSDANGILKGDGAKARTYKVTNVEDIDEKALIKLVKESIQLGM